jgi:hypothetical protein
LNVTRPHLLVVFGFGRHRDLLAVGGEHAAALAAAGVALVLTRAHLGMLAASSSTFGAYSIAVSAREAPEPVTHT